LPLNLNAPHQAGSLLFGEGNDDQKTPPQALELILSSGGVSPMIARTLGRGFG
jgi:hypothetical protein